MMWICSGTPEGHPPNSAGGIAGVEQHRGAGAGAGLRERLGRQRSEREADVHQILGRPSAASRPRSMIVPNPIAPAWPTPSSSESNARPS